ncbi:MAG: WD40/YVTN/BNR-like repeat-containing protein [Halanaeroarchaeum sp.]
MPALFVAYEDRLLRVGRFEDGWQSDRVLAGPNVEGVAAHPETAETVFCATFDRGLQRSTDAGDDWERVGEDVIDPTAVTAVAVDPTDPDVVYAGTEPSRVYRSSDRGDTWRHAAGLTDLPSEPQWSFPPRPETHHVRWIEVDPTAPGRVYVSIEAGAIVRTEDGGETWTDRVASAPRDAHWLATHEDAPGRAWVAAGDGYAETDDGGDTWEQPMDGLAARYCWSLAVDPGDPDTVLLSAASGPRTAHRPDAAESFLYRRRDGEDWTRLGDGFPDGEGVLRPVVAPGFDGGEFFVASNRGLYRTPDAGDSWATFDADWPPTLASQTPRGIAVVP